MDIPLQLHEFYPLNHVEKCPAYTESLHRIEFVQLGDLDALYTDLETLQGAANIRLRKLEEEVKILSEWCDKKDRSKSDIDLNFMSSTSKRTRSGKSIFTFFLSDFVFDFASEFFELAFIINIASTL